MGPREMFGELALFCGGKRTATVVAIQDALLLLIDRRELFPFLRRHPDAAIKLLEVLALRVQNLTGMMEDTTFLNLPQRLGKRLLDLAERYGKRTPEGMRIEMKINQTELGDLVATTRESINKQFRAWSEEGVASMSGGYVTILDEEALRRIVEEE
jgi:CRP/FNR family transcriptional regulator, cyclic AMP receptor protein